VRIFKEFIQEYKEGAIVVKSMQARLEKLEHKIGTVDDDVCMVFVPSGDKEKDDEKLKKLHEVSERTGTPVIILDF
jgi:hypothetical protein